VSLREYKGLQDYRNRRKDEYMLREEVGTIETQSWLALLCRNWWTLVLRGAVAVLLGLAALGWPEITLRVLVMLLGAYLLIDGAFGATGAIKERSSHRHWWIWLLEGVAGIVAGLIAMAWPGITAVALLYLFAAWALITGILEVIAAVVLRREISGEWLLVLAGAASIIFGIIAALRPQAGLVAVVWVVAVYAIAFGILLIILGVRLRSWAESMPNREQRREGKEE
jgi:uncharacterized membrane protein HdeD (DUF308 family)